MRVLMLIRVDELVARLVQLLLLCGGRNPVAA
jgi:hypothetical protein